MMDKENLMFEIPQSKSHAIKVIGVGGGGSNAVNHMFQQGITGVDFVVCNTDAQALQNSPIPHRIQLGASITEGMGAGANPEVGEQAALESMDEIKSLLDAQTKMVFITAGMGGGTGTGAAPVIASIAKELGILTVGICTAPFYFEGKMRLDQSEIGIEKLRKNVDSLIVINNDKLRELYGNLGYKAGFAKADEVLTTAAKGIAEVITHHYATNIDLRDARTVLANSGTAIMGSAKASGENKAKEGIAAALDSPLLNNNKITGAQNVLLLIVSGEKEITIDEIGTINDFIQQEAGHNANIIMGIGEDLDLGEEISITIVATGFPMDAQKYTGKEEEKVYHRLEDDQAIVQNLTPENSGVKKPLTPRTNLSNPPTERISIPLEEEEIPSEPEITFQDEEEHFTAFEKPLQTNLFEEALPEAQTEKHDPSEASSEEIDKNELANETAEEKAGVTVFRLDLDEEIETVEDTSESEEDELAQEGLALKTVPQSAPPTVDKSPEPPQSTAPNPFDSPLNSEVMRNIQEQRERLRKYNYKFSNSLSQKEIDEVENIPAFQREGLQLNNNSPQDKDNSGTVLKEDAHNELKLRPNEYLHKNVD